VTRRLAATAFLCLGWLAACGGDRAADPVQLTEAESGLAVALEVGQEVVATLAANPSTGFHWSYRANPEGVLGPIGESEYVPDQPVIPGSGGRERFRFTGLRAGSATLEFEYRRPFEPGSPPARTVSYSVVVR
jgi:inhibitor of cysteine peptidase